MKTVLFVAFLFFIPLATAFNCNTLNNSSDCITAQASNEDLIANLIYINTSHPDHQFINRYNEGIIVNDTPQGYTKYTQGNIHNAWVALLAIQPSVMYDDRRYCTENFSIRTEYNYHIVIPPNVTNQPKSDGKTCQILRYKTQDQATLSTIVNAKTLGIGKNITLNDIKENTTITEHLTIQSTVQNDQYTWHAYCCRYGRRGCTRWCWNCPKTSTTYDKDILTITDNTTTAYDAHIPQASFSFISNYSHTTTGTLTQDRQTSIWLQFANSNYTHQSYIYTANFTKKPFYLLELHATNITTTRGNNLLWNNDTFYIANTSNCSLTEEDFFRKKELPCTQNNTESENNAHTITPPVDWTLLFKVVIFLFINYTTYQILRKYWHKAPGIFLIFLFSIPFVHADSCGLTNLATCLPEQLYNYFLTLINAPLAPLLEMVKNFLITTPSIDLFYDVWKIIVYCISFFYTLLFMYAGYQFLTSGHNILKREMAKEWLKNTVIMIVLIQASFYLYTLFASLGSSMTSATLTLVDPNFFLLTTDNVVNVGLEFLLVLAYVLILFATVLLLCMRYLIVAFGILFVPIGVFCYFLPPLRSYGKFILHVLGLSIFITFIDAIIILGCSKLITLPFFANLKMLVMINCFFMIDLLFFLLILHIIFKSSFGDGAEQLSQAAKYLTMLG